MKQKITLLFLCLFTAIVTAEAQSDVVVIETPHNRTVSSGTTTLIYDITAKNAGTLSATVSDDATGWMTATLTGTRLSVYVAANASASTRFGTIKIAGSNDPNAFQTFAISQQGNEYNGASLASLADTKLSISSSGSSASSVSSGSPFSNTYDDNTSTIWHSNYANGAALASSSSVTCTWDLGSSKRVDYITYIPRQDGSINGNFGAFRLQYSTNGYSYTTYGSYDFEFSSNPSSISLGSGVTARYWRVVVTSGGNNHVSCAEMIFSQNNTSSNTYTTNIFGDALWTTLKSGVTQTTIDGISNKFVKDLAQAIYNGGYSTKFRLHTAQCFKSPDAISEEWNAPGKYYDRCGNVTGISVPIGAKIGIMVGDIPSGAKVGLLIRSWYPGHELTGSSQNANVYGYDPISCTYALHSGLNIIDYNPTPPTGVEQSALSDGLAYITYFGDTDDEYANVQMHFLNGIENGYLSLNLTNDEMHNLCKNAANKHMDVVTDHAHLVWEANALYNYCKTTSRQSKGYRQHIRLWNFLIEQQHYALGLQKYNRVPKTRTLAYVNYQYFMFQGNYGVAFHFDQQSGILNCYSQVKASGASVWGISHEWGHQHQMQPYFNWAGCDEATNNYNAMWNTVACGLTDTGHGCHPAFGTTLYNGVEASGLTANDKTVYTTITNTRQNAYDNISEVSYNSYFTTLVNNTYNNHLNWTNETKQNNYSFDFTNYCTARPFIAISFYAIDKLGLSDFSFDLFEAIRQTDKASGTNTTEGSSIEKTGVDKYELLAAAQNGNKNSAYTQFRNAYSSSVWTTKSYLNSSHLTAKSNSVPFILNYIRKCSRLTGYNLVPYFKKCGMLRTVSYRTFGGWWYLMTDDMLSEFEADMNSLGLKTCNDTMVKAILTVANPSWTLPSSINNN